MGDPASSKLDTIETSVDFEPNPSYRSHRASFHSAELPAAQYVYRELDFQDNTKRTDQLESCRTKAYFYRHEITGKIKVRSSCCRLRWCPMCAGSRRYLVQEAVGAWVGGVEKPKFLTLTLKHSTAPLEHQLKHLYGSFRKLRVNRYLRGNVHGGVWFFQVKRSSDGGSWHPHLHCLIDSTWLDHGIVSSAWLKITGTSCVVDIRAVHSLEGVADYVSRYAAKPSQLSTLDGPLRIELVRALHGRRLVGAWGTAKSMSFRPVRPPDAGSWHNIGYYTYVAAMYRTDINARKIFRAWKQDTPLAEGIDMSRVEDFVDNRERHPQVMAFEPAKQLRFAFM